MRKLTLFILLLMPVSIGLAAMIDSTALTYAQSAMKNVKITSGTWTDPADLNHTEPVLFIKFTADYGIWGIWHTCAITWVKDFISVTGDRTLNDAINAKTAHGYKAVWNDSYKPAPAGINPWCIQ